MEVPGSKTCNLCNVHCQNRNELLAHYKSKKHVKKHKLEEAQKETTNGIFVTGLPKNKSAQKILQYFSQFGSIIKHQSGHALSYMILVYDKIEDAEKVLSTIHLIDGSIIIVQKRRPIKQKDEETDEQRFSEEFNELLKRLGECDTFEKQLQNFIFFVTPDSESVTQLLNQVISDMRNEIKKAFYYSKKFQVFQFGSSVTNLQFKSSDIDFFVTVKNPFGDDLKSLKVARNHFHKCKTFRDIVAITSAKIPVIKCVHNFTNIKCDITFRNMCGVRNSQLIKYYLSLDERLRSCMLVIKYWAKIHDIAGSNRLFNNYSLVMMFIYYLQTEYAFPSVKTLQMGTVPNDPTVIWNLNFVIDDSHKDSIKTHNSSELQIVSNFFSYYQKFDYKNQIICPYLGETLTKNIFSNPETIPYHNFMIYRNNIDSIQPLKFEKAIVLQDPFEHNVNTCSNFQEQHLDRFVSMCELAHKILSGESERDMLSKLFSTGIVKTEIIQAPNSNFNPTIINPDEFKIFLFMRTELDYLRKKLFFDPLNENELTELWYREVVRFIRDVFEKFLRFEVHEIMHNNAKSIKLEDQADVHDCIENTKYRVVSYLNLWMSRKFQSVEIEQRLESCRTSFERELIISEHLWEENKKFRSDTPLFTYEIDLKLLKNPVRVEVNLLKINSYKKLYKSFGLFFSSKLPQWFNLYESDMNKLV